MNKLIQANYKIKYPSTISRTIGCTKN